MAITKEDEDDKKIKEYKERFNRWHLKQIDLLTFLINFLFTVSTAASGFIIANQDKPFFKCQTFLVQYSLSRTALFIFAVSITLGVFALITRLEDFRRTKSIPSFLREIHEAVKSNKPKEQIDIIRSKLDTTRRTTTDLGKATWVLFYAQLITFMITLWFLVSFA